MSEDRFPNEFDDDEEIRPFNSGEPEGTRPEDSERWLTGRSSEPENSQPRKLYEKEVKVVSVYEQVAFPHRAYFVLLRDNYNREFRIYIGQPEAMSISMATEGQTFVRPLTHDLMKTILERLGWRIERVIVDDLYNDTFYAKLTLTNDQTSIDIDCRPSDAIALAVRAKAPIYAAEDVIIAASRSEEDSESGSEPE
ncbi:MAG: bifunctional nuclease family protein [Armatimonadota bacterium]